MNLNKEKATLVFNIMNSVKDTIGSENKELYDEVIEDLKKCIFGRKYKIVVQDNYYLSEDSILYTKKYKSFYTEKETEEYIYKHFESFKTEANKDTFAIKEGIDTFGHKCITLIGEGEDSDSCVVTLLYK